MRISVLSFAVALGCGAWAAAEADPPGSNPVGQGKVCEFAAPPAVRKVGADRIIFPEREMAEKLAESLASPKIFDFIELSETHGIIEMVAPKKIANKTLSELGLRTKYKVSVIAIRRKIPVSQPDGSTDFKEEIVIGPGPDDEIIAGDVLILLGKNTNLDKIEKL